MTLPFELTAWTGFGFVGQAAFGSRFLIQWIASERKGRSHFPMAFWYLSVLGGIILTIYAVGQRDLVFTLGQGLGLFIYLRNIVLVRKYKERLQAAENGQGDETLADS